MIQLSRQVGLSVVEPWQTQWEEVTRVFRHFFRTACDNPAEFWGHTVCWPDRAIRRQFLGSDLKPVNQTYRTLPSDQRLKLNFPGGRKASLDPGKLQWLPPRPYQDGRDRLVKVVESRKTVCGAREATTGHREAIGAYADLREDDKWLKQSLFPGLRTRVYSLCEDLHGSLVGIQAVDALQGGSYVPPETYRVVDSQGILNPV